MDRSPLLVPTSELRGNAAGIVRVAARSLAPVYVTQRGSLTAVLLARPVFERMRHEHEILCRIFKGELEVELHPGMSLGEVLREGERALDEERLAEARKIAREARRLAELEQRPPDEPRHLTTREYFREAGIVPDWPGGQEWLDMQP
jgi:hypothetical protein